MSDIESWLQQHDLGKFARAFAENEIKLGDLSELTDEDFKDLGLPIGPRRRLQKAIRTLVEDGPAEQIEGLSTSHPQAEAERRQLTVMFCDLVDSVALGERMELEDYRELLTRFRAATTQAVESFNGFIARHHGDGLLVYFGYPHAHEDDAGRAVRAALDVVRAVGELASDAVGPQVRIGIATGSAIVGDVLSTDASAQPELAAFGATPNLAARLQGQAQPNQVLVSETTQDLTRAQFEYARTDLALKGIEGEVFGYQILVEKSAANRLDVTSGRQLTPLVGRQEELALLHRRWQQAVEGNGQVALICAEPGVGKTRMMMEAQRRFGEAEAETMLLFCSPYHSGTSLYPVADYLSRTLQSAHGAETVERLAQLEHWLDSLGLPKPRFVPLLATLLSLELPEHYSPINLDGAERRRRTNNALVDLVLAHAARRPVLLVVEDLHWVDPTTQDFLGLLIEAIRDRRVFALITYRPEMQPPWSHQRHLTTLTLNHLTGVECRQLLRGLNTGQTLPDELIEQIVDRTDGVPLFVEELLRTVLEAGADSADAIPQTLRDALTARLDRLGEAKRLAQLAAVIGRVFPLQLLQAASGIDPAELQASLDQLLSSGLAYHRTLTGGDEFAFKHALIRDCAYQSLLRDERRGLHRRVADALETTHGPLEPDVIAIHAASAGDTERAIKWFFVAGTNAAQASANAEAVNHYRQALAQLATLSGGPERDMRELEILQALGVPLIAAYGYPSPQVEQAFRRASALSDALAVDDGRRFAVLRGLWNCLYDQSELVASTALARELMALAAQHADASELALANRALGSTLFVQGDLAGASVAFQHILEDSNGWSTPATRALHGEMPEVTGWLYAGWVATLQGRADSGLALLHKGLERARQIDMPLAIAFSLSVLGTNLCLRGDVLGCARVAHEQQALCDEHGFPFWNAPAAIFTGWAAAHEANSDSDALARMHAGMQAWTSTGASLHVPTWSCLVAEVAINADRLDEADRVIAEASALAQQHNELFMVPELLRLQAELQRRSGDTNGAISTLEHALELSAQHGSSWLALRIATDLAMTLHARGETEVARRWLAPALEAVSEGRDCPRFGNAIAQLAALG